MEPEIRFCTSADGTRISYTTYGRLDRTPVVIVSGWVYAQDLAWRTPAVRWFTEALAEGTGAIGYDRRGTGRSTRELRDLSTELEVADLEAVVESARLTTFDIFAYDANPAVPFVARHNDLVRRLVLYGAGLAARPYGRVVELVRTDWALARRALASILYPEGPVELQKLWSNSMRDHTSPDVSAAYMEMESTVDLREEARKITVPTLVIGEDESKLIPEAASDTAQLIPDTRMVQLRGHHTWYNDPATLAAPVLEFFGHSPVRAASAGTGTAIILFADIADSTALTERTGDAAFRQRSRALDTALRETIALNAGSAVEGALLGDGVLATFGAAHEAVACATEMHGIAGGVVGGPDALSLHIGIHAGDVIRENDNVFGGAVNIAARIAGEAPAGQTFVSQTVRDLARTSAGVSFEDRGEHELRGVSEPVRIFAVVSDVTPPRFRSQSAST